MSSIDTRITSDLAALREDSARQLGGIEDALRTTNMYRDDRPGAEARRDALADERRRELVMMPLTLAHVFAHRVGRAAAGATALVAAMLMILMLSDPLLLRFAAWFVPGLDLVMVMALVALGVLGSYVVATWIAEAWFERRMRQAIRVGADAYQDLDALARGPIEIAQAAARRADGPSTGLLLAGASAITIVFGYVVLIISTFPGAWVLSARYGTGTLTRNLDTVIVAVVGVSAVGLLVGRACSRPASSLTTALVVRVLGHWAVLPIAMVLGGFTLWSTFHMFVALDLGRRLPPAELRYGLAIGSAISIFVPAAWSLLWWRRRESARIGDG
ncbi:MAG: hypothetical protein M3680_12030 [Myxococcota bacterium]|nr:hypothetical protein [Myxococcota bacterium]